MQSPLPEAERNRVIANIYHVYPIDPGEFPKPTEPTAVGTQGEEAAEEKQKEEEKGRGKNRKVKK